MPVKTTSTKEHINLDVIDVDYTSLNDIEVDPIKCKSLNLI